MKSLSLSKSHEKMIQTALILHFNLFYGCCMSHYNSSRILQHIQFTSTSATSILPLYPRRLLDPGWSKLGSLLRCALKSKSTYHYSDGFLYNNASGLCTPVAGLADPREYGARAVDEDDGSLYFEPSAYQDIDLYLDIVEGTTQGVTTGGPCPIGYKMYEMKTTKGNIRTCLMVSTFLATYHEATNNCSTTNGSLTAMKSSSKEYLLKSLIPLYTVWIGLDDLQEQNHFVWQLDGTTMTDDQRQLLFESGEPDILGIKSCAEFTAASIIKPSACTNLAHYICEVPLN